MESKSKRFCIRISGTFSRVFEVDADNYECATKLANTMLVNEPIPWENVGHIEFDGYEVNNDPLKTRLNTCAHCGKKLVGKRIVFDSIDAFCNEDCAAAFFGNDKGCVDILLDDGRLVWKNE